MTKIGYGAGREVLEPLWSPLDTVRLGQHVTLHIGDGYSDLVPITATPYDVIFHHDKQHRGRGKPDFVQMARCALEDLHDFQVRRAEHCSTNLQKSEDLRIDITLHIPPQQKTFTKKQQLLDENEIRAEAADLVQKGKDHGR